MTDFSDVSLSEISINDGTERLGLYFGTLAGLSQSAGSTNGIGSAARFDGPYDVAVDTVGNVFVADSFNNTIRKVTRTGRVTTLAGLAGSIGTADGTGSAARFSNPRGITVDTAGNVFVADTINYTIRKVTRTGVVTTLAGLAEAAGSTDGTGSAARFNNPYGITVDTAGNLFVADTASNTIRKVTSAGVVTTLAGTAGAAGSADGTGSAARFNDLTRITIDTAGNLFVGDRANHTIRKVTSAGVVTTIAGTAGVTGSTDGTGSAARFYFPSGVAVDTSGNVFVADSVNSTIRKVTSAGIVTTLAGTAGASDYANGTGSAARFRTPYGITVAAAGNVFVADSGDYTIRNSNGILTAY
jgi:hypothetical protein